MNEVLWNILEGRLYIDHSGDRYGVRQHHIRQAIRTHWPTPTVFTQAKAGQRVCKKFDDGNKYHGTVTNVDLENGRHLYKVVYDDGDVEDVSHTEMAGSMVGLVPDHPARQQGCAAEHATVPHTAVMPPSVASTSVQPSPLQSLPVKHARTEAQVHTSS